LLLLVTRRLARNAEHYRLCGLQLGINGLLMATGSTGYRTSHQSDALLAHSVSRTAAIVAQEGHHRKMEGHIKNLSAGASRWHFVPLHFQIASSANGHHHLQDSGDLSL